MNDNTPAAEAAVAPARPLAVHVSELSNPTLGDLHRAGYEVMPNTTGWLLFLPTQQAPAPADLAGEA